MTMELTILQNPNALRVMQQAPTLRVESVAGRTEAADIWDAIRAFRKQAEEQKEDICRPLKQTWEETKKPFDDFVKECKEAEARLQRMMSDWDREQLRLQREEQARLQRLVEEENARRRLDAVMLPEEPAAPLLVTPILPVVPKTIATSSGTTQTGTVKKTYAVCSQELRLHAGLPDCAALLKDFPQLFVLDQVAFNGLAKAGLLDGRPDVTVSETMIYTQRRG